MRRFHLVELEDQPWFPRIIRDVMTDHLSFVAKLDARVFEGFAERLRRAMDDAGEHRLVDLCTGGSGPAFEIAELLGANGPRPVELVLTDLYPNEARLGGVVERMGGRATWSRQPIDALRVPPELGGFRLICNAFHHFRPEHARQILADAVAQKRGIAVFEAMSPGASGAVQAFVLMGMMWLATPFARPLRASRVLLTCVIPLAPLSLLFDGLVSWLRVYSPDELRGLVASLGPAADAYTWDIGRLPVPGTPLTTTFLIGTASTKPRPLPPPVVRGSRAFGSALDYLRDPLGFMLDARRQYGGVVRVDLKLTTMYVVSDPECLEEVFVTDAKSYIKDKILREQFGDTLLGRGLLTNDGDGWLRQRRLTQPAFHRARIASYASVMSTYAGAYASSLRVGDTLDLQRDMLGLTLRVVLRTLLSNEAPLEVEIANLFREIGAHLSVGISSGITALRRLPLPRNRRFARAVKRLDEIVRDAIHQRRAGERRDDLLSMLIEARDEHGRPMSDRQLRDEIVTMFSGGYETTALAIAYGWLMLTNHPEIAARLRAELARVLGGRVPTIADLPSLQYTDAVLRETMRLYPPAWDFGREAIRDTTLGRFAIPRGAQLHICPWVVHRDPATFGPDPLAFRPERWLDGLAKRIPRFAYIPFGGGARQCIGNTFAMTEATIILATLASRFRLRTTIAPDQLRYRLGLSMQSRDGIPAVVEALA